VITEFSREKKAYFECIILAKALEGEVMLAMGHGARGRGRQRRRWFDH